MSRDVLALESKIRTVSNEKVAGDTGRGRYQGIECRSHFGLKTFDPDTQGVLLLLLHERKLLLHHLVLLLLDLLELLDLPEEFRVRSCRRRSAPGSDGLVHSQGDLA